MDTSSSSSPNIDFPKQMVVAMSQAMENGSKWATEFWWKILMKFLAENWAWVFLGLFVILIYVSLKAMMGKWGSLGSFLYNLFYFGTLFVIGLVWGPQVFVDDIFNAACAVILYPVCYLLVGIILDKTGLKNRRFK